MAISIFMLEGEQVKVGDFEILEKSANDEVTAIIDIIKNGFDIATNDKIIRFKQLQFPNKKMLNIADILNGKDLDKYIGYKIG